LGLLSFLVYGGTPLAAAGALGAAATVPAGEWAGRALWRAVERPNRTAVGCVVAGAGVLVPLLVGLLDLYLRLNTPAS
jgi:hypothetical protein